MFGGIDWCGEVSRVETVAQRGAKLVFQRVAVCRGSENRGSVPNGEALESVRGLTRAHYSPRVNGK